MNPNLGFAQGLSARQELSLAPQLLQWLRLLQEPSHQLERLVHHELETNPALEIDEGDVKAESEADEGMNDREEAPEPALDDWSQELEMLREMDDDWRAERQTGVTGDMATEQERHDYRLSSVTDRPTLRASVIRQIALMGISEEVKAHAALLAGTLDPRGYLPVPLEQLADETDLPLSDLEEALAAVQECEPEGVGARDLRECLLLQLTPGNPDDEVPRRIVSDYLEALAGGHHEAMARHLRVTEEEVRAAADRIRRLNPHPGKAFAESDSVQTVTPDVIIRDDGEGGFQIEVVEWNMPRLRISRACRDLIQRGGLSASEVSYVRSRIRAAMFLIDGLQKRNETLRRIAEHIVRVQHRFLRGDQDGIRPLTMAKVAGLIGVHDTTVSRALAEKFMDTPGGVFPMKRFFQSGYQCDDGSALTPDMVRGRIERLILREDPCSPIKDETIAKRLQEEGIPVARRTVAKYRGELGLPSSKERAMDKGRRAPKVLAAR